MYKKEKLSHQNFLLQSRYDFIKIVSWGNKLYSALVCSGDTQDICSQA